ncbi:MAG: DinB family protein [Ferruginibacter sp.]
MTIAQQMLAELQQEAIATRKILSLVPVDRSDWKPHDKSMSLLNLARHTAEIYGWPKETVEMDELDFSKMDYTPKEIKSTDDLLAMFEKGLAKAKEILEQASDEDMAKPWTMRNGEIIYFTMPKAQVMRTWVLNHSVHHRAQLGVYLRMLDIPLPGTYGPTADEQ